MIREEIEDEPWCACSDMDHLHECIFSATREGVIEAFRFENDGEDGYNFHVFRRRAPRPIWELIQFGDNDVARMFEDVEDAFPDDYGCCEGMDCMDLLPRPGTKSSDINPIGDLANAIEAAMRAEVRRWCEANGYAPTHWIVDGNEETVPFSEATP